MPLSLIVYRATLNALADRITENACCPCLMWLHGEAHPDNSDFGNIPLVFKERSYDSAPSEAAATP
jgi:hypothetical protein